MPLRSPASCIAILAIAICGINGAGADELPKGYWTQEKAQPILQKALRVHLAPALDDLSVGERLAVKNLIEVGRIMQRLYEDSRHPEALTAYAELRRLTAGNIYGDQARDLNDLYRLSKGPIVTSLDNKREAFLPVTEETPGKNVYPAGIAKGDIDRALADQPELRNQLLHLRAVVRRSTPDNLDMDLTTLDRHAVLCILHPGLRDRLIALQVKSAQAGL